MPALAARVAQAVANVLKLNDLDPEANLVEHGADSVDIIRVANLLEKEFGLRIDPEWTSASTFRTVLCQYIPNSGGLQ